MRRLIAIVAVGIGIAAAGCGGQSAEARCATYKANAQTWAQNFVSDLPNAVPQGNIQQLATARYRATAASHGLDCP